MSKLPKRELPAKKKWWQLVVAVVTVTTGIVGGIAAFSGNHSRQFLEITR
jgi:hypothetical protein